ncbi:MAG: chromate transporter [Ruminococcaceae bacterium]|nr:chromate transporter [Oscillospiraceae bacterium]
MIYLTLFYEFFKAGLFAVGGGLATLPFLYNMADNYSWFTHSELTDMIAISESTPGPIGVNMATYSGFNASGVLGGIVSTLGLILPSIIIILIISSFLNKFKDNKFVEYSFYGIRPAVCGLISAAVFDIILVTLLDLNYLGSFLNIFKIKEIILFAVLFILIRKIKIHPIFFILASGIIGIILL